MRILYVPFFSNAGNHNGCSIYNVMKVFFRHLVDTREDAYVYFLLPKNFQYQEEEILNHPRIEKVYVRAFSGQHDEKILLPEELFDLFNVDGGKHFYNAVVCDKNQITTWVKLMLEGKERERGRVPFFNFAQFIAKKEGRFGNFLTEYEYSLTLGWLSGWNVFQNERHMDRCLDIAKKYLTPAWVMKIAEQSKKINLFGVDIKRLNPILENLKREKHDKILVNYPHRMATHYNPMKVMDIVDKVFRSGVPIKFVITTPSISDGGQAVRNKLKEMEKNGLEVEIHNALPQDEFYKVAGACDLFISAIDETETANSIFEQIYLGQVGILPKTDWVDKFLPGYPFQYKNFDEAYFWVKNYSEHPDEMRAAIESYRDMIRQKWDIRKNAEAVYDWMYEIIKTYKTFPNVVNISQGILEAAGNPKSQTLDELRQTFKDFSRTKIDIFHKTIKKYNKFDWIKAVLQLGYVDTCEKDLRFKKNE